MSKSLYAFLLLMVWCAPTWSQTTTISIDGVDVRLGMTKKQAQEKFPPERYVDLWESDFVMLVSVIRDLRRPKGHPDFQVIGKLVFANDRLVRAFKTWQRSENDECMKVGRGLFNSLLVMNGSKAVPATVSAWSLHQSSRVFRLNEKGSFNIGRRKMSPDRLFGDGLQTGLEPGQRFHRMWVCGHQRSTLLHEQVVNYPWRLHVCCPKGILKSSNVPPQASGGIVNHRRLPWTIP